MSRTTGRAALRARSAFFRMPSFRSAPGRNQPSICCSTFRLPTSATPVFSTGASRKETARRQRQLPRRCGNTKRWGQLSAYYYFDDYNVNNPYPSGQGGATVPGFAGLNLGRSQLVNLGHTKTFGSSAVNEFRAKLHAQCQQRRPAFRRSRSEPCVAGFCHRSRELPGSSCLRPRSKALRTSSSIRL